MRTSPGQAEASALGPVQIQKLLGLEPTNSLEGKKAFVCRNGRVFTTRGEAPALCWGAGGPDGASHAESAVSGCGLELGQ